MTSKPIWHNEIERNAWVEKNCRVCFQPDEAGRRITGDGPGCPHLARSDANKMPVPWTRRRNAAYGDTYRCDDFAKRPPVDRRPLATVATEAMFELLEVDRNLVPVDGWPDYRSEQRKTKEGDHQ